MPAKCVPTHKFRLTDHNITDSKKGSGAVWIRTAKQ